MYPWQFVFRNGLAPQFTTAGLRALAQVLPHVETKRQEKKRKAWVEKVLREAGI